MKVKEKGHTVIIKRSEESIEELISKIQDNYATFQSNNLVIDVCNETFDAAELSLFEDLKSKHKNNKKSFVVVFENADFNEIDEEEVIVVPSLQEAFDIIEMEEIERDLGF